MKLIYLVSPYTHPDLAVRQDRFDAACRACVALIAQGFNVFSPIVHSHPLTEHGMGGDWSTWEAIDQDWIDRCDEVHVLTLDGFRSSVGVRAEVEYARSIDKPVVMMAPAAVSGCRGEGVMG